MTKRLQYLLAVLLLTLTVLPAAAESLPILRLYRLAEDAETPELLGCGVLFEEQDLLLTALPDLKADDTYFAAGADVMTVITGGRRLGGMLQLLRMADASGMTPMTLADFDAPEQAACVGLSHDDQPVQCYPLYVQQSAYGPDASPALEVTLMDDLLPGALLTDGQSVCGLVVARLAEGDARYVVVGTDVLTDLLSGVLAQDNTAQWPWLSSQARVIQDGCTLTIDWSSADLSTAAENDRVWTILMVEGNCFYEYNGAPISDGSHDYIVAPGSSCLVWVYVAPERPAGLDDRYAAAFEACRSSAYTDYGYHDEWCYLAISRPGQTVDADHLADPLADITGEALLNADHAWLQVVSAYDVSETVELEGCITLYTPEGYQVTEPVQFILEPELAARDVWAYPLDDLLAAYLQFADRYATGAYALEYCFGDHPVSRVDFILE